MYNSNLKIKPSTAWVKPLVMSPVEHSNKITHVNVKLLPWIRSVIWENCVNYKKNNRYKFVYERQSTNETCYRCTMGKCSARIYIDAHGIIREGTAQHIHADSVKDMNYEILRFYNNTSICRASSLLSLWLTSIFQSTIELLYFCQCTNSSKCVLSRCVC